MKRTSLQRKKPMKRSPWPQARKGDGPTRQRGEAVDWPSNRREPHPWAPHATYAGTTTGPIPKGPKHKTGKRAPTVEERRWLDAIVRYGCVACRMDGLGVVSPAVHHILRGGVRLGHLYTLPLCDPGHHQNGQQFGIVSRHPFKARFEQIYGSELHLLAGLRATLGWPPLLQQQPDGSYTA